MPQYFGEYIKGARELARELAGELARELAICKGTGKLISGDAIEIYAKQRNWGTHRREYSLSRCKAKKLGNS